MQYDDRANGKQIDARVNEEFEVSLSETRTAGYRWVLEKSGQPNLRLLEDTFAPNTSGVGGTGRHFWRFRAVSAGETELELDYCRPWETAEPTRTFALKVRVRP